MSHSVTPWTAACQASLSFTISQSLLKLLSIESMMPSNYLILGHPLLLLFLIFSSIRYFPMSWLFPSGGQSIGASASASVFAMNIQGWFSFELTGLISTLSKSMSMSKVFSSTTVGKHQFFVAQPSLQSNSHIYNLIYCSPNVTHYARHPGLKQNETSLLPSEGLQNHGRSINTKLLCDRKCTTYMDAEVPSLRVNALKIL